MYGYRLYDNDRFGRRTNFYFSGGRARYGWDQPDRTDLCDAALAAQFDLYRKKAGDNRMLYQELGGYGRESDAGHNDASHDLSGGRN